MSLGYPHWFTDNPIRLFILSKSAFMGHNTVTGGMTVYLRTISGGTRVGKMKMGINNKLRLRSIVNCLFYADSALPSSSGLFI